MKLPLRLLLLIAIVLTTLTILQNALGLTAPLPDQKAPLVLDLAGFDVTAIASSPQSQGRDFSQGRMERFRLQPRAGGSSLDLTLLPVRSRNDDALQMARLSELEPRFALQSRRLLALGGRGSGKVARLPRDELAFGLAPKGASEPVSRLQTCLTPTGVAAVTTRSIHEALRANRQSERGRVGWQMPVARLLGLRTNARWECLAVQLETKADDGAQRQLLRAWAALKPRLLER